MATEMPAWFITQYNKRAMHVFQHEGHRLRGTVMPADRMEGEKAKWRLIGKGEANDFQPRQRATPANSGRSTVEAILKTSQYFDEVDEWDGDRAADPNSVQEREKIYQQGGMALGRKADRDVMAVFAGSAPTAGSRFINLGATAFSAAAGLTMCQRLQAGDIPWGTGEVYCALPSLLWNQFLTAKQVNSSEHVGGDLPFTKKTDTRFWNGVNWFLFPDQFFPSNAANTVDVFLWHKEATGFASHTDLKTDWQWENSTTSWTVNMRSKYANVALQPEGLVRLRAPTNTEITFS